MADKGRSKNEPKQHISSPYNVLEEQYEKVICFCPSTVETSLMIG